MGTKRVPKEITYRGKLGNLIHQKDRRGLIALPRSIKSQVNEPRLHAIFRAMFRLRAIQLATTGLVWAGIIWLTSSCVNAVEADLFRFASWNMNEFWHIKGEPLRQLRSGATTAIRTEDEITRLKEVAEKLNADVIMLQSVGSVHSVRQIFPAQDYYVVFSRQLADRFHPDVSILTDPAKRLGYTALAVRRSRPRWQRYEIQVRGVKLIPLSPTATPHYAVRNRHSASQPRLPTVAGLVVRLSVRDWKIQLLVVDLVPGCETERNFDAAVHTCLDLMVQFERVSQWIKAQEGDTKFIVSGSLRRAPWPADNGVPRDPLWRALSGDTALPRRSDRQPKWIARNRSPISKRRLFPPVSEPSRDPHTRLTKKRQQKGQENTEYRGVSDLIRSAFSEFWERSATQPPEPQKVNTTGPAQDPEIPPKVINRYVPTPLHVNRTIQFPDGFWPGHCHGDVPNHSKLTHDYMLLSQILDENHGIVDYGTHEIAADNVTAQKRLRCINYVDIRIPKPEPSW